MLVKGATDIKWDVLIKAIPDFHGQDNMCSRDILHIAMNTKCTQSIYTSYRKHQYQTCTTGRNPCHCVGYIAIFNLTEARLKKRRRLISIGTPSIKIRSPVYFDGNPHSWKGGLISKRDPVFPDQIGQKYPSMIYAYPSLFVLFCFVLFCMVMHYFTCVKTFLETHHTSVSEASLETMDKLHNHKSKHNKILCI